jgi:hypothetical protein
VLERYFWPFHSRQNPDGPPLRCRRPVLQIHNLRLYLGPTNRYHHVMPAGNDLPAELRGIDVEDKRKSGI